MLKYVYPFKIQAETSQTYMPTQIPKSFTQVDTISEREGKRDGGREEEMHLKPCIVVLPSLLWVW